MYFSLQLVQYFCNYLIHYIPYNFVGWIQLHLQVPDTAIMECTETDLSGKDFLKYTPYTHNKAHWTEALAESNRTMYFSGTKQSTDSTYR